MSLSQRILAAKSEAELNKLIDEGLTYEYASAKLRRRWFRLACYRLNNL